MEGSINMAHIVEALNTISTPKATPHNIHIANSFLAQCQQHPQLSLLLLDIYQHTNQQNVRLSSLLLLTNVLKRNWVNRGRGAGVVLDRSTIKTTIIQAASLQNMKLYKHFNSLLKVLARQIYPSGYPQLHNLILTSLDGILNLSQTSTQSLIGAPCTVPILSMSKSVIKQYSNKRIAHKQEDFREYIAAVVSKGVQLSQVFQHLINSAFTNSNYQYLPVLLEYLRKADKIALYGLLSMPTGYQSQQEICDMVKTIASRLPQFNSILLQPKISAQTRIEVQKYLTGMLQLLTKMQHYFPFSFSGFLKDYLQLINSMLISIVEGRYSQERLISAIFIANFKIINTYPFYTAPSDFRASIYHRKGGNQNNLALQEHCHEIFREVYNQQLIQNILITLISRIMVLDLVADRQNTNLDELVLEDVEITIVDQVSEPAPYQNCLSLCKILIKNFRQPAVSILNSMLGELSSLREQGPHGQLIINSLIDIVLFLPQILDQTQFPLTHVQQIMTLLYQQKSYKYLARLIRKYYTFLNSAMQNNCLNLLIQIVSSPIVDVASSQIIYQAALALKTCLAVMSELNGFTEEMILPCMTNILKLIQNRQFLTNPTIIWPLISLVIKLISIIHDYSCIDNTAMMITSQLSSLLSTPNQEELIACALSQLMVCILYTVFRKIKTEFPVQGQEHQLVGVQTLNKNTLFIFEGVYTLVIMNLKNNALQNYDNIYRLWLTLLRHYPTLYQQNIYGFQLDPINLKLKELFDQGHQQVLEDSPVIFLQIVEEMYLVGLLPLDEQSVTDLVRRHLLEPDDDNRRIRTILACLSLYLSFAITRQHIPQVLVLLLREMVGLKIKVSPTVNALRCFLFLAINHHILTSPAADVYTLFTKAMGSYNSWLEPLLCSMQYVSSKEASKINSAALLKAINDIGVSNYLPLLFTPFEGQVLIDYVLRTIHAKLDSSKPHQNLPFHAQYKTIIPNQLGPQFSQPMLRKIHLHFGNPLISQLITHDLRTEFRQIFNQMFALVDWGTDDLQERVGCGTASTLADLLGWKQNLL